MSRSIKIPRGLPKFQTSISDILSASHSSIVGHSFEKKEKNEKVFLSIFAAGVSRPVATKNI